VPRRSHLIKLSVCVKLAEAEAHGYRFTVWLRIAHNVLLLVWVWVGRGTSITLRSFNPSNTAPIICGAHISIWAHKNTQIEHPLLFFCVVGVGSLEEQKACYDVLHFISQPASLPGGQCAFIRLSPSTVCLLESLQNAKRFWARKMGATKHVFTFTMPDAECVSCSDTAPVVVVLGWYGALDRQILRYSHLVNQAGEV
jgi:hypothetical protein